MNRISLFLVILMNFSIIILNAQITIREKDIVEKAIYKPKPFDSLSNICIEKKPIDYKKYIGYKLYFLPKSKNFETTYPLNYKINFINFLFSFDTVPFKKDVKAPIELTSILNPHFKKERTNIYQPHYYKMYDEIGTFLDSVEGKYFSIIDIQGNENFSKNEFKKLEDINDDLISLKIKLRNESNNDTLYWIVERLMSFGEPFFLVPYFEKQRNMYLNQNLVLRYNNINNLNLENLIDVNTGELVTIKYGEVWTCNDVSFVDSKDHFYLKVFYFLKNGNREVKIELESNLIRDYFMLESDFKKQELDKQKKEEQRIKEEQELKKIQQQEKINFTNDCIAKWGQKNDTYIADGKVVLGMSKEMCVAAWGNPILINRTLIHGLTSEQWVYGYGTYLYFDNGVLTAIQN